MTTELNDLETIRNDARRARLTRLPAHVGASIPNQIVLIVEAMRPDFGEQVATEILVAAQEAADWGRSGTMEASRPRASYR